MQALYSLHYSFSNIWLIIIQLDTCLSKTTSPIHYSPVLEFPAAVATAATIEIETVQEL